jgi:tRNA nucleotidyltransferase (CCA-adding enzyme)
MIGVPQSFKYHKEGDVFTHTMLVLDTLATSYRDTATNPIGLMLSALFHDLGKIKATTTENGEVHSYKHEMYGVEIAFNALYRITEENDLINYVLNMVENHMRPHHLYNSESHIKKTNKMFDESVSPSDLIYLAYADTLSAKKDNDEEVVQAHNEKLFLVSRYHTYSDYMSRPYVMGRDLVEYGLKPGKYFAEALEFAHKLRLAGVDRESALNQTIKLAKKLSKNMN